MTLADFPQFAPLAAALDAQTTLTVLAVLVLTQLLVAVGVLLPRLALRREPTAIETLKSAEVLASGHSFTSGGPAPPPAAMESAPPDTPHP